MNPLAALDGYKMYLAAAGFLGLAIYQFSTADYPAAWGSLMAAWGVFSAKKALLKVEAKSDLVRQQVVAEAIGMRQVAAQMAQQAKP